VAALADSAHDGDLTGAQLQSTVEQTADDVGLPGTDQLFGRGRVNAFRAAAQRIIAPTSAFKYDSSFSPQLSASAASQ
jgi:hypothetical protein